MPTNPQPQSDAEGPDHAQARALALQVVPPTAYHAQFSVEQRAAYNLARAYLALAPQPSVPSGEAAEPDFAPDGTIPATLRPAVLPPLYAAPPQERVSEVTEAMVEAVTLGLLGTDLGKTPLKEAVRYALTAALAPSRRARSGDGGGEP